MTTEKGSFSNILKHKLITQKSEVFQSQIFLPVF